MPARKKVVKPVKKALVIHSHHAKHQTKTIVAIVVLVILGICVIKVSYIAAVYRSLTDTPTAIPTVVVTDFFHQTYMVDNQPLLNVQLVSQAESPLGTRSAAIITSSDGGSGTFYYLVGAITNNGQSTFGTPVLLGDRIRIGNLTVNDPQAHDNGQIIVTYFDYTQQEAMSDTPTLQKTQTFAFEENADLTEVK